MTHIPLMRNNGSTPSEVAPFPPPEDLALPAVSPHWSLAGAGPRVFHCRGCGAHHLLEADCCGSPLRRVRMPYYVAVSSGEPGAPEFSIVVLTKDHVSLTQRAVESLLRAAAGHRAELIIVDCASTDGSHSYFRDLAQRVPVKLIVTHPEEPFVYARNCNRGAQAAVGRYLVFANNDIEVQDEALFAKLSAALA